ncbi:asparagine synthase (glutamine-hydrolyzing) [Colwellia psychrerythraea]|uniref:asparagine synthase (glutamine-hydrolyzing) n=1 Tax=Colwellia psychrerythraea TaxID=28229 RepID=A0A099KS65_COLPS|nr:asparagine synthase (glutamine-hydrolyzing) [Colwellia psychrerythraea]KGJ93584.1 asparagine synthase (glutamine-hydrolyzing) [Colwellia psychrerythraea]
MCGISGIINKENDCIDAKVIQDMNDLIIHRGPDSEGFFFGDSFAFGHRRLSILDLSPCGHQPMNFQDKYVITYNGEVYNYIELQEELIQHGYTFQSETDTEVILAAYDFWGEECVQKFNGMWSFAIYNKIEDIIFCSRDRFGVKPFFYSEVNNNFVFGSEIKQLLPFHEQNIANLSMLLDFLVMGLSEHTEQTFFEGVYSLKGGSNLIYDLKTHTHRVEKYYNLKIDPSLSGLNEDEAVVEYQQALQKSVKLRLRSDVKVGTCLSGGLDSSAVASIAAKINAVETPNPFNAITASSLDPKNDETSYAEKVVKHAKLNWNVVQPSHNDFLDKIDEIVKLQDEPVGGPSIVMQYVVFKKAKETGCKVMLDGQGGDETLLGYERYYPSYLLSLSFKEMCKGFFKASDNSKLSKFSLLAYCAYFLSANLRKKRLLKRNSFIKPEYFPKVNWYFLNKLAKSYKDIFKLQKLEIFETQMPHLLRYEDRNSMAHSIEARLPFIDYQLVETALSLPNNYKINEGWTKFLLRKAIDDYLPKSITWRKNKIGFEAPADIWLKDHKYYIQNAIANSTILKNITNEKRVTDHKSIWLMFFIAKWEHAYNVKLKN